MRKPRSNSKTTNNSRSATNAQRSKRVRYGALPQPPEKMVVPYAQSREELKNLTEGQLTEIVMGTQAFKDEIGMVCDKLDSKRGRRGNKRGTDPLYSAWECEAVFVYQRVCGLRSVKEARDRLAGDRGNDARRILGFNKSRETNPDRESSRELWCNPTRRHFSHRSRAATSLPSSSPWSSRTRAIDSWER